MFGNMDPLATATWAASLCLVLGGLIHVVFKAGKITQVIEQLKEEVRQLKEEVHQLKGHHE